MTPYSQLSKAAQQLIVDAVLGVPTPPWATLPTTVQNEITKWVNVDDTCNYCVEHFKDPMMPPHKPSSACESGKKPHCTCDACY